MSSDEIDQVVELADRIIAESPCPLSRFELAFLMSGEIDFAEEHEIVEVLEEYDRGNY